MRDFVAVAALWLCAISCTGGASGQKDAAAPMDAARLESMYDRPPAATAPAGPRPLARLSKAEYANTLRDLFHLPETPYVDYPDDTASGAGFPSAGRFEEAFADAVQESAEDFAAAAVSRLSTLHACADDEATCARSFVASFGRRAFRRPLSAEETARLIALYDDARRTLQLGHANALGVVIEALLQTPQFLYHFELGAAPTWANADNIVALNNDELASRLSYFLWASMPDDSLFAAADAKRLAGHPDELRTQARRLLGDPRAASRAVDFHVNWLRTDDVDQVQKNTLVYGAWQPYLVHAAAQETQLFVRHVFGPGDHKVSTLLVAPFSFVNWRLGDLYFPPAKALPRRDEELRMLDLPENQRAGLLTQIAFLAKHGATNGSNPVKRGHQIAERLLCREIPPPGPNIPAVEPPTASKTTRERFATHVSTPSCQGCHATMDPLGFAFENYDGIGQHRIGENNHAVDASGTIDLDGGGVAFRDAVDLLPKLAASREFADCYVRHWFRYGWGRLETAADKPSLDAALTTFLASGTDLHALLIELAASPSLQFRAAAPTEPTE